MSSNLVSANNLAVNNNLTVNGTITGSNNISTTSNIQGANITATSNVNATNVNLTGQLNGITLTNLNSLDTTSSIQTQLNFITGKQTSDENNITSLQTKTTPLTYNSPNLGIFNTNPSYPLDISASTYRIGPVAQINSNGTFALINTNCASDPANFALYQGVNGDTVLNCGLNETIEFKVHNSQVAMLNSSGIGIGNSNPQFPLDVSGPINASTDLLINGTSISPALSKINSLITICACGYWNGSAMQRASGLIVSGSYGTFNGIQGVQIELVNTIQPQGYIFCQSQIGNSNIARANILQTGPTGFIFIVQTGINANNSFYWMVI